jgi:hypothetical protein
MSSGFVIEFYFADDADAVGGPEASEEQDRFRVLIEGGRVQAFEEFKGPFGETTWSRTTTLDENRIIALAFGGFIAAETRTWSDLVVVIPDHITYHLAHILCDEGENPGVLSVTASIDPSPFFPDDARLFVGAPEQSPLMEVHPEPGRWLRDERGDRRAVDFRSPASHPRCAAGYKDHT